MLLLAISVAICGCAQDEVIFSDQYIFGQDSQYGLSTLFDAGIAQSEKGYYFCSGPTRSFLYFYDYKTNQSIPLCNKPNCLHVTEPDGSKIADCNAYISNAQYLRYYKDALYYVTDEKINNEYYQSVYRVSTDGTRHQRLYTSRVMINNFQIHRGSIYFSTSDASAVRGIGESDITTYKLYQYELNKPRANPIIIDEGSGIYTDIGDIICYGNNIYFETECEQNNKTIQNIIKYNILTNDKKTIINDCFPQFTIFNDKLIYMQDKQVFYSDLNGDNRQKFSDELGMFYSNDNYLFIDNMMYAAVYNLERTVIVIDKNWNPVKTISLKGFTAAAYGCSDEFFFIPEVGKYNEYGEIISLFCVPVNQSLSNMNLVSFHEFKPQVPFHGINTKD